MRRPAALVTRMSRPPNAAIAAATTRSTSAGRDTSAAADPAAPISAAARAASPALREQMKTRAPSPAKALAQALPNPLLAPATKALQSVKPRSIDRLPGVTVAYNEFTTRRGGDGERLQIDCQFRELVCRSSPK